MRMVVIGYKHSDKELIIYFIKEYIIKCKNKEFATYLCSLEKLRLYD